MLTIRIYPIPPYDSCEYCRAKNDTVLQRAFVLPITRNRNIIVSHTICNDCEKEAQENYKRWGITA